MATITSPSAVSSRAVPVRERTLLFGIGLSSFAALLLELGLTRLFSVVLFYHFAFLAISIALLGLGAGGVCAYLFRTKLAKLGTQSFASALCCANAIAIPAVLEVVLHIPVSLELTWMNLLKLSAIYLSSAVPFFLVGLLFSVVFARESRTIARLYGADLLGGALACLAIVPLLNWVGGPNAILFAAVAMALAARVWANRPVIRRASAALAAILLAVIAANHSGRLVDVIYAKGTLRDKAWVEFARWNAISRVEVDRQGDNARAIVIDADASTYVMNADPHVWEGTAWQKNLMASPPALANVLRPHGEYAIIGPGGGVDVLRAVANGSPSVTGIEINPIIATAVMRDRYADYSQHLYQRPEVHMQVTDGRSFVRNADQHFDVVQMTLVDTWASTAAGAFALSENSLYTVDAFLEYFEHLKPDGLIAITRWEFREPREALRVVSVATEALHQLGVANPANNFIVVSEGDLDEDGIPVVVLAKKSAFTREEEDAVRAHLERNEDLAALYLPSEPGQNPFSKLIARNDPSGFAHDYPYNVAPVDDNAPFFFFTLKTDQILHDGGLQRGIDWKVNLGVVVLGMVFIISAIAVLVFLLAPMLIGGGRVQRALPALLCLHRVGLHPGGDRLHPAFRIISWTPHLCADGCDFSTVAIEWRWQPVFPQLVIRCRASLGSADLSDDRHRCLHVGTGTSADLADWTALPRQAGGQCGCPGSAGICHGDAISHRSAGFGDYRRTGATRLGIWRAGEHGGQFDRVGVGHECRRQRAWLRAGHGDRHSFRTEYNFGMRRCRLPGGACAIANPCAPSHMTWRAASRVCYHQRNPLSRKRRGDDGIVRALGPGADSVSAGAMCLARSN